MIAFLVGVTQFFIALFVAIMFLNACLMGLALLDYMLDIDVKGHLNRTLGPRPLFKKLMIQILEFFKKHDQPSWKDMLDISDVNYDKDIEEIKRKMAADTKGDFNGRE